MLVRVTLREIAAAAGVHYSTVSLALRDHPRISAPIRKRIKELADQMGYAADPALSALNAYRKTKLQAHYQSTIAWINNWQRPEDLLSIKTFNEYFQGASECAMKLGYKLEEVRLKEMEGSAGRASRILQSRGIKGLLWAPQEFTETKILFNYDWFSSVSFGYSLKSPTFHLVTNHHFHSIVRVLQEVERLGYMRAGLFLSQLVDDKVENGYTSGFWSYSQKNRTKFKLKSCIVPNMDHGRETFFKWYQKATPDVVITNGYADIRTWLGELGLNIPRDIGYVDLSVGKEETTCSGIYENGQIIGEMAVKTLVGMLQHGEYGIPDPPIRILVEGQWRRGETLRRQ